ncbi:hypothetical protein [Aneurinibacillus migulanus]|uniref:hypothetical protein n=1 Tax=Aneurinibacillus migulanus TaxID=47500 RepID=UPI000B1E2D11|nr:hypothetical protein [Aneurinibacillus migulanus]MCP1358487.1 hypothetical protein [Aneurinibacillus migulanus]
MQTSREYRKCANCWWAKDEGCMRKLCCLNHCWINNPEYLCYGWRPINFEEKHAYLERYGYEHKRVGIILNYNKVN